MLKMNNLRLLSKEVSIGRNRFDFERKSALKMYFAISQWIQDYLDKNKSEIEQRIATSVKNLTSQKVTGKINVLELKKKFEKEVKKAFPKIDPKSLSKIEIAFNEIRKTAFLTGIESALDVMRIAPKNILTKEVGEFIFELSDKELLRQSAKRNKWLTEYVTDSAISNAQEKITSEVFTGKATVFQAMQGLEATGFQEWRAFRIVQTEIQTVIGTARHEMFDRSGVQMKRWITVGDNRVREEHLLNEAQGWIPTDTPFQNGALHPGSYPSSINCRCVEEPMLNDPKLLLEPWSGDEIKIEQTSLFPKEMASAASKLSDYDLIRELKVSADLRNPSDYKHSMIKSLSWDDYIQDNYGMTKKELIKKTQEVLDNSSVYMAVRSTDLKNKILSSGEFKNSLETGKGTFKTIGKERAVKEKIMFGIPEEPDKVKSFPKYGFLSDKAEMNDENIVGFGYGDTYVKFKDNVKNRSTYTLADSYDGNRFGIVDGKLKIQASAPASPIIATDSSPWMANASSGWATENATVKTPDFSSIHKIVRGSYAEAQIYGKLSVSDIDSVFVQSKKEASILAKAFKKSGYSDIEIKPSKFDSRLKAIIDQHVSGEGGKYVRSLSVEDIDRLGDEYIKKLEYSEMLRTRQENLKRYGNKIEKHPPEIQSILDKYKTTKGSSFLTGEVSLEEERKVARYAVGEIAKKEKGAFDKTLWDDYRESLSGWTEDVINKDLLKGYVP